MTILRDITEPLPTLFAPASSTGDSLLSFCPPHLEALARYAMATGCRAREITGLEWDWVDLVRQTA